TLEPIKKFTEKEFERLKNPVKILLFAENNLNTKKLLQDIVNLNNEKLSLTEYDIREEDDLIAEMKIDKTPAIVIHGLKNHKIRFFGTPTGIELESFISTIVDVSTNQTGLPDFIEEMIHKIKTPVHLEVFVTPTCSYCPMQVRLVHSLALINDNITGDMILSTEFPEEAAKNKVISVPTTKITKKESRFVEGVMGARNLLNEIMTTE
ncbi:MAG: thioredoxin family protein, partial [Candidatus Heimdallarchaeota archaeon]|nr:thioredoxin family protein [Candidatus Heimdallarchaeota archaeon]